MTATTHRTSDQTESAVNHEKRQLRLCPYTTETIMACRHYAPSSRGAHAGVSLCRYAVLDEVSAYTHRILCHREDSRPSTALVVEDDDAFRDLLRMRLQYDGFAVRTACNGEMALRRLRESPPDLLITDWHMPTMDGIELIHEMRHRHLDGMPVLVLTGDPNAQLHRKVEEFPDVTVLAKGAPWCDVRTTIATQQSNAENTSGDERRRPQRRITLSPGDDLG